MQLLSIENIVHWLLNYIPPTLCNHSCTVSSKYDNDFYWSYLLDRKIKQIRTCDGKFPKLLLRVVVEVVVQEEERGEWFAVVWGPLVKASRALLTMHVHLA